MADPRTGDREGPPHLALPRQGLASFKVFAYGMKEGTSRTLGRGARLPTLPFEVKQLHLSNRQDVDQGGATCPRIIDIGLHFNRKICFFIHQSKPPA